MNSFLQVHKFLRSSRILLSKIEKTSFCYSKSLHASSIPVLTKTYQLSLVSSRNFWESFPLVAPNLHLKDGLDKTNYELIYRAKLFNYAFYAQLVSMSALASQVGFGLYYAYQTLTHHTVHTMTHFGNIPITYDLISVIVLGIFTCQNLLTFVMTQRALLRVYHKVDTDEYAFVSLNYNPFKTRLIYCKPGELKPLHLTNLWAMLGNYEVKGNKFFIRYHHFRNVKHFNRLLSELVDPE